MLEVIEKSKHVQEEKKGSMGKQLPLGRSRSTKTGYTILVQPYLSLQTSSHMSPSAHPISSVINNCFHVSL